MMCGGCGGCAMAGRRIRFCSSLLSSRMVRGGPGYAARLVMIHRSRSVSLSARWSASPGLPLMSRRGRRRFAFSARSGRSLKRSCRGLRNQGMFAAHELREGVPRLASWSDACGRGREVLPYWGRGLVERLGFRVETHAAAASILSIGDTKRAIAVFLDEGEEFEANADRFGGSSPVSHALALADREGLPWLVLTRARQIRVYAVGHDIGVGRKGRSETFVEANLALLPEQSAGYVDLLFSAGALRDGGTFEAILDASRDHAAELGARLRERIYSEAVPALAGALADRHDGEPDEAALAGIYEQALVVLFRLLFVAYAEDKDLLPYRTNGVYRENALKTLARELAERRAGGQLVFDENAADLWDDVVVLWLAVDRGNVERGVPAYNGGLFSSEPDVSEAGAALADVRLTNAEFGSALAAMLVDEARDGVVGPVDFRSLSAREFGTIYEGLLESSLSVAPDDLTLDAKGNYVPAREPGRGRRRGRLCLLPQPVRRSQGDRKLLHEAVRSRAPSRARARACTRRSHRSTRGATRARRGGQGRRGVLRLPLRRFGDGLGSLPRRCRRPR